MGFIGFFRILIMGFFTILMGQVLGGRMANIRVEAEVGTLRPVFVPCALLAMASNIGASTAVSMGTGYMLPAAF